jgi:RNA polymerase sigma factor (sigma-70 family)
MDSSRQEGAQSAHSDGEFLQRFLKAGDEVAFEVLVWRHGPAVLNLCRRILANPHDAEDAFQATFLMLVLKAGSVRTRGSLGRWLYKVAMRIALEARERCAARARRERHDLEFPSTDAEDPTQEKEQRQILHEEINRLPERYRLPVVLCYLSGQTTEQAALALGCPRGTVLSRLATARQRLHRRLVQRGITLSGPGLVLILGAMASQASTVLVQSTVKAAANVAAGTMGTSGLSGAVLMLIEGVLNAMFWTKIKTAAVAVFLTAAMMLGFGLFARPQVTAEAGTERKTDQPQALAGDENRVDPKKNPKNAEDPKTGKPDAAKPAPGRREAVIKVPVGTFVKDIEAGEYGSGRVTWTYEEDKVFGTIEANVMGFEVEVRTEAEFSISRNGTIYGIVTSVELTHLKIPATNDELAELGKLGKLAKFAKLAEPLINETLTDLPFSYQFRINGDKLTILNFRALLAGPNPLGKLGGMVYGGNEAMSFISCFQALGVAMEGTYTVSDPENREKPKMRPPIRNPNGKR